MSRRGQAFIVHALSAFGPIASKISQQPKGIIVLYLTIQGYARSHLTCFPGTRRYLHPLKRALTMVFLPMDFVVSSVYWSLRTFAPSLILLPTETSSTSSSPVPGLIKLPLPTDLAMHLAPFVSLLIDFTLFEPKFSSRQMAIAPDHDDYICDGRFAAQNDIFPYPFLDVSSLPIRIAIYVGCLVFLNRMHSASR
ncbi:FAR-17a/AIG1-like protein-domain-containing protein [Pisolithus microcarpus]|nr:FAR-17a/AIG1-like protein-domain-containing protein [Pisolithus microcarpus]